MKYNFTASVPATLPDLEEVVEGLTADAVLAVEVKVDVHTELSEDHVEALRVKVSAFLSEKLGGEVEASLLSEEA